MDAYCKILLFPKILVEITVEDILDCFDFPGDIRACTLAMGMLGYWLQRNGYESTLCLALFFFFGSTCEIRM